MIVDVATIDTASGMARPRGPVRNEDGRISAVGQRAERAALPHARVVQGTGKFLIPGLWDAHVHLGWAKESALAVLVANGVTGVRDLGGHLYEIDGWRTRIEAGLLSGPRIFRAGPILNGIKANEYQMLTGTPDEARGAVRALKQVGVHFIKVHRRTERAAYFAIIEEAKAQGLAVVGHIPMTVTPEEASDAGQQIEHTETIFEGTFSAALQPPEWPEAIRAFRTSGAAKRLFERFARNGTVFTPALIGYRSIIDSADGSLAADPRSRYVAASYRREGAQRAGLPSDGMRRTYAELVEVVRIAHESGVTMMAGTDLAAARLPGFHLHEELALLAQAGLSPTEALRAATLTPAKWLGQERDFGSVEEGKVADLVLLDANPLEDIRNTQKVSAVVVDGKLLERGELDAVLQAAERLAGEL